MGMIVPSNQQQAITPQMRADAQAAQASIEASGGGPYLYLAQPSAKVVVERQTCRGGEYVIIDGDRDINVGSKCMVIVVSQHVRFKHTVKEIKNGKETTRTVWDAAREAMTEAQAAQADMDWSDPRSAKPYNSFFLVHTTADAVDPYSVKIVRYKTDGLAAKPGKKWVDAIANQQVRGVPMFAQVWELGSELVDTGHNSKMFIPTFKYVGGLDSNHPAYATLKESHQHAEAMKKVAKGRVVTGGTGGDVSDDDMVVADKELDRMAAEEADRQASQHYATELPPEKLLVADTQVAVSKGAMGVVRMPFKDMLPDHLKRARDYHASLTGLDAANQAKVNQIIKELEAAIEASGDDSEPPF